MYKQIIEFMKINNKKFLIHVSTIMELIIQKSWYCHSFLEFMKRFWFI